MQKRGRAWIGSAYKGLKVGGPRAALPRAPPLTIHIRGLLLLLLHWHLSVSGVYLSVCDTVCIDLYPGQDNRTRLIMEFLERGSRHPQPPNCPREMYEIMLKCWMKAPERRPTFEHLFNTMNDYNVAVASSYAET